MNIPFSFALLPLLGAASHMDIRGLDANGLVTWVEELYVEEDYRGNKIGKALMQTIEDEGKKRNTRLIALATRRASKFYEAIGYEKSATYYKKTIHVI